MHVKEIYVQDEWCDPLPHWLVGLMAAATHPTSNDEENSQTCSTCSSQPVQHLHPCKLLQHLSETIFDIWLMGWNFGKANEIAIITLDTPVVLSRCVHPLVCQRPVPTPANSSVKMPFFGDGEGLIFAWFPTARPFIIYVVEKNERSQDTSRLSQDWNA